MFKELKVDYSGVKPKHIVLMTLISAFIIAGFLKSPYLGAILTFGFLALSAWVFFTTHDINIKITPRQE